ncbi:MAG: hypothetical protein KGJ02_01605 [Verrucomicrobiota bacterium]|nr:hypothetical protein [Verrucomicrobiota bacterium]
MSPKFILELSSNLDFEGMVVELSFEKRPLARLNYDLGIDNIEIEMLSEDEEIKFPLADFFQVLEKAKQILIRCDKEDKQRNEKKREQ